MSERVMSPAQRLERLMRATDHLASAVERVKHHRSCGSILGALLCAQEEVAALERGVWEELGLGKK